MLNFFGLVRDTFILIENCFETLQTTLQIQEYVW